MGAQMLLLSLQNQEQEKKKEEKGVREGRRVEGREGGKKEYR